MEREKKEEKNDRGVKTGRERDRISEGEDQGNSKNSKKINRRTRKQAEAVLTRVTLFVVSVFSLCSVLPLTFLRASSMSGRLPGPFFLFSLARIEDSLSGNGGISSKTVAYGGTEGATQ